MHISKMILEDDKELERRFERNTYIVIIVALASGLIISGWRMALGILLGGVLSLFNKRWLQASVKAIMSQAVVSQNARVPRFTASKFILRYLIIGLVIGAACWIGYFDPLGIGIGFVAFVGGVMMESFYQLYLFLRSTGTAPENSSKE